MILTVLILGLAIGICLGVQAGICLSVIFDKWSHRMADWISKKWGIGAPPR